MKTEVKYTLNPQTREDRRLRIQTARGTDGSELQLQASSNRWRLKARRTIRVFVGDEITSTKFRRVKAWRDKTAFEIAIDAINTNGLAEVFKSQPESTSSGGISARDAEIAMLTYLRRR